jgi:putative glutamine amidotransferase
MGGDDYDPGLYGCNIHPSMELAHPQRTHHDWELMKRVLSLNKPVLAICAGLQMMNIASGGKLIPHIQTGMKHTHEYYHSVSVKPDSILKTIFGKDKITVNSYHHQAVNPDFLGNNLKIIACSPDSIPEAIEVRNKTFQIGVQWHPERIDDIKHRDILFTAFIKACCN